MEDYVVSGLVDFETFPMTSMPTCSMSSLGGGAQCRTYLSEEDTRKVLRCYQKPIAQFIHSQMQAHYWEETVDYEVKIKRVLSS